MEGTAGQGLLFLFGGSSAFLSLFLTFRWLGRRFPVNQVAPDAWIGRESLAVFSVLAETPDIVTVTVRRQGGRKFPAFKPGQFLTVQIGADPKVTRSYSISSSANDRSQVSISVKKIGGGLGSTFIHSLKAGDSLIAFPPSGAFSDAEAPAGPRVFIAGGIGITPMYSMIRTRLEAGGMDPLTLIYGARSDRDLAFHSGFLDLAKQYSNFKYNPVVGQPLNMDLVRSHVDKNTQVYICGPTPMMDALAGGLMELAVPDVNIHTERFVSPQSLDASRLVPRRSEISLDGQVFIYDGKQPLLDFFENAGVEIPYACRTGVCGTCKCRARGETESLTDAGLSLRERRDGWILTCVSFPRSDRLELKRK